jgi:tripartite-type tricarboxylate transporter receptor subunit TctC
MNCPCRFLRLAAIVAILPAVPQIAWSQAWPARPVHVVVGFPAGSSQDIVARIVAPWLSERLSQPFIIDNRPGAGGNIGVETVVNAPPDGYTLLMTGPNNAVNATLYDNLNFTFVRDIAPVAGIMRVPLVMEVNLSVPARTVPEFIAYAKANPGKINMASAGNGTAVHVSGELFKMMTGIDMLHVPYRGTPLAMTDLFGGRVR